MDKPLDEKALEAAVVALQEAAYIYSRPFVFDQHAKKMTEAAIRKYLEATQAGESEAVRIADAVLKWFVQQEILDAGNEYLASDIVEVLENMVDPDFNGPSFADVQADNERLLDRLESIQRYGLDTLSGRANGSDDRKWHRDAVNEMTKRATAALRGR